MQILKKADGGYRIEKAGLTAGQPFALTIDYQRQSDALSAPGTPVAPQAAGSGSTPKVDILPWIVGGVGVLLLAAGSIGIFVWLRGSWKPITRRHHKARPKGLEENALFCHQCGQRAKPDDVFCRACGTRLRRKD